MQRKTIDVEVSFRISQTKLNLIQLVEEEKEEQLIGVKVIDPNQAPDPRKAIPSKCKNSVKLDLILIHSLAYIQTDEEKKLAAEQPTVTELLKKKAAAAKKARNCHDEGAFKTYIYRVLKEAAPEMGISQKAMHAMNTMVADKFDRIMSEGRMLVINGKKQTLSSKDVETACKLLIPGELGKGAISQGRQALKERA